MGLLALTVLSEPPIVRAEEPAPDNTVAQPCLVCHAGNVALGEPAAHVPLLFGQSAAYLTRALKAYANGSRQNAIMKPLAAALSARDIAEVSAYFAGERAAPPPPNSSGSIPATVVETCSACHGETGLSAMPEVAVLSGQYADYLERALEEYASGERRNPVMPVFARSLSAAERHRVADYFAQRGVLRAAK